MKIKNICGYLFFCLALSLKAVSTFADEISDLANAIESRSLDKSQIRIVDQPTDIVTTEVVGGNNPQTKNISNNNSDDAIGSVLIQAMSLMGISYKWGGNTPETGMDCSGFIRYVFKKSMGITLPRTAAEMARVGKKVSVDNIQPGDLIFFNTLRGRRNSHVGMYIGEGQFIQSPRTGQRIQISAYNAYWRSHTNGVKRIVQENTDEYGNSKVEDFENIHNEALPSGYIKGELHLHRKSHKSRKLSTTKTVSIKSSKTASKPAKAALSKAKKKRAQ